MNEWNEWSEWHDWKEWNEWKEWKEWKGKECLNERLCGKATENQWHNSAAIARAFLSLTLEPQCSADNASKEQPQSMRTTSLATLRVKHSQNERANE